LDDDADLLDEERNPLFQAAEQWIAGLDGGFTRFERELAAFFQPLGVFERPVGHFFSCFKALTL
jgi:hypothetical protein